MAVVGVKQLKEWFLSITGARPLNSRGKTVDFQDNGEPDEQVFRNLMESSLFKKVDGSNFQDQATFQEINTRTTPDKFTTPANLPKVSAQANTPISITTIPAADETDPAVTYRADVAKATYATINAGLSNTMLTPENYPLVTADPETGNLVTVTPVQSSNKIDYRVKVMPSALPSTDLIIDTNYTNLMTLLSTSTLQPGKWYRFSYRCIHQIPYTNVLNIDSALTVNSEDLLVQAISTSLLDRTSVRSMQYPQDIIHWRYEDNIVTTPTNEDPLFTSLFLNTLDPLIPNKFTGGAISYVSPTVNRAGRIYYREDTIQRVSTPYDFRGVVFRRWALEKDGNNNYSFKNALTYTNATLYKYHEIILHSGIYYLVVFPFTSTVIFEDHLVNLTPLNSIFSSGFGAVPVYIATNPTAYILYNTDNVYFTSSTLEINVTTDYQDSFTFYSNANTLMAYNVHIENYIPAWVEAVTWEFYPNIVFGNHLIGGATPITNVKIGRFSYDLTLYNVTSIDIDNYCRDIFINGRANNDIGNIKISKNNQYIHLDQYVAGGETVSVKRLITNIGLGNRGLILSGGAYNIGDNNNRVFCAITSNIVLGNSNYLVNLISGSSDIENFNSFICLKNCILNTMGDRNRNIFSISGSNTVFGSFNVDITSLQPNPVEGVALPHHANIIKDQNSNIIISGNYNTYNKVSNLSYTNLITLTSCSFDDVYDVNLLTSDLVACSFSNCEFKKSNSISFDNVSAQKSKILNVVSFVSESGFFISSIFDTINNLEINNVLITFSNFKTVNNTTLDFVNSSSVTYCNFNCVFGISLESTVPFVISLIDIVNSSNIVINSELVGLTSITLSELKIDSCKNLSFLELNDSIITSSFLNCEDVSFKYVYINKSEFRNFSSNNIGDNIPLGLDYSDVKISIIDSVFNNVSSFQIIAYTNDSVSITDFDLEITDSSFINVKFVIYRMISSSINLNYITSCFFSQLKNVVFGQALLDINATENFNYEGSVFENILGNFENIQINTPYIVDSYFKNFILNSAAISEIAYRVHFINCKFDGIVAVRDNIISPTYSEKTIMNGFQGAGYFVKDTDATLTISNHSISNKLQFTSEGIDLDALPADGTDTFYTVIDSGVLYGLQHVITMGTLVPTSVDETLI